MGNIINFSTVAAPLNLEGEIIYASTKSAVEKLTKITAYELAQYKNRVMLSVLHLLILI